MMSFTMQGMTQVSRRATNQTSPGGVILIPP